MCVCVHLYVTAKGRTRYSMARQKNYRERVKGDRTFNNSWSASDVISYSSDVVSISPDESLIYNYLRFSPTLLGGRRCPPQLENEGKQTSVRRGGRRGGSSSGNCSLCAVDEKRVHIQVQLIKNLGNPLGRLGVFFIVPFGTADVLVIRVGYVFYKIFA